MSLLWDGFNNRKFLRLNVRCEVQIETHPQQAPISTVTENLGVGGVCVNLSQKVDRLSQCKLRLELDKKLPWVETIGKIVWVVPTRDSKSPGTCYDTGIEFVSLASGARDLIRDYLAASGASVAKPR